MNESRLKNSVLLRMVLVGVLTLVLLPPTVMIESLIIERQERRDEAIKDVSQGWGGSQLLTGPILTVPYMKKNSGKDGDIQYSKEYLQILPEHVSINSSLDPNVRYRGIYEVILYNSTVNLSGDFSLLTLQEQKKPIENLLWDEASVTLGISDLKGIKDSALLMWEQVPYSPKAGTDIPSAIHSGVRYFPAITPEKERYSFSLQLNLNGATDFRVVPVGKETSVMVSSPWSNPSFLGSFLPESRTITSNGFEATWRVLELNRNIPDNLTDVDNNIEENSFGVRLLVPVDEYQKTMRTVKYAIMFIALTFLAYFLTEVLGKILLHPVQYGLIGFALVLFYALLLSLSEHVTFNVAYLISSISIIGLITVYTKWITQSGRIMMIILSVLVLLYSFLYVTLQLQDYALLLGSLGLLLILSFVMYLTRKIDWFSLKTSDPSSGA
ncbi:MAG: cell envelope integrity protein CreD [Ignavibacteriae bacterium]|nr:cell envelope integrity protein CreD [Ignavibacteriota bacterium]